MSTVLLTCVIPVYRGAAVLPRAVASVLAQDMPVDLVLVDDASGDDSLEVMLALAAGHPQQIRVMQLHANSGQARARNAGAGLASTPYLAFLDQDDAWAAGFARQCITELERHPVLGAVKTGIHYTGLPESMAITAGEARDAAMVRMHGSNMVIRHEVFWALGGFATEPVFRGPLAGEDSALQRALQSAFAVGLLGAPLFHYQWRAGNVLDLFASRTRSVGRSISFSHYLPAETSGELERALQAHGSRVRQRTQRLGHLLTTQAQATGLAA